MRIFLSPAMTVSQPSSSSSSESSKSSSSGWSMIWTYNTMNKKEQECIGTYLSIHGSSLEDRGHDKGEELLKVAAKSRGDTSPSLQNEVTGWIISIEVGGLNIGEDVHDVRSI